MLRKLTPDDFRDTLDLFIECFRDDHYFRELYQQNFEKQLKAAASENIRYCLTSGTTYGIFDVNKLSAFILLFDYQATKAQHKQAFDAIFDGADPTIQANLTNIESPTLYLMLVAVTPGRRRQGFASKLLDTVIANHPDYTVVSDVSAPESIPMYQRRNFLIEPLGPDYFWVQSQ